MNDASQKQRSNGGAESSAQLRAQPDPDDDAGAAPATEHSPDLRAVMDAWPTLSPAVKASIVAMATAG